MALTTAKSSDPGLHLQPTVVLQRKNLVRFVALAQVQTEDAAAKMKSAVTERGIATRMATVRKAWGKKFN